MNKRLVHNMKERGKKGNSSVKTKFIPATPKIKGRAVVKNIESTLMSGQGRTSWTSPRKWKKNAELSKGSGAITF